MLFITLDDFVVMSSRRCCFLVYSHHWYSLVLAAPLFQTCCVPVAFLVFSQASWPKQAPT